MNRDLRERFIELLGKYTTMSVATADMRGNVDCATVYFAFDEQGFLYFATDTAGTMKAANLRENSRVAATMDDGGLTGHGLQIRGKAEQITGTVQVPRAKALLLARIPHIEEWLKKPTVAYYRIIPGERYLISFSWGVDWRNPVPW